MISLTVVPINLNPFALRRAKIAYNFGLSGCNWVKDSRKAKTVYKFGLSEPVGLKTAERLKVYAVLAFLCALGLKTGMALFKED